MVHVQLLGSVSLIVSFGFSNFKKYPFIWFFIITGNFLPWILPLCFLHVLMNAWMDTVHLCCDDWSILEDRKLDTMKLDCRRGSGWHQWFQSRRREKQLGDKNNSAELVQGNVPLILYNWVTFSYAVSAFVRVFEISQAPFSRVSSISYAISHSFRPNVIMQLASHPFEPRLSDAA